MNLLGSELLLSRPIVNSSQEENTIKAPKPHLGIIENFIKSWFSPLPFPSSRFYVKFGCAFES
jgi:hypothetical protein